LSLSFLNLLNITDIDRKSLTIIEYRSIVIERYLLLFFCILS